MFSTGTHAFKSYDECLKRLETILSLMVDRIMDMKAECMNALAYGSDASLNEERLTKVKTLDHDVNALEFECVYVVHEIVTKYNPSADELRFVIGSIKLTTILESIADRTKNSMKRLVKSNAVLNESLSLLLSNMVQSNCMILQSVRNLLRNFDEKQSELITETFRNIEKMHKQAWEQKIYDHVGYYDIVMFAKNEERIADMIIDMKKITYFIHTGQKLVNKFEL